MRKLFFLFLWLSCLPFATRGQTIEDADLSELLLPIQAKALCYWYDSDDGNRQTVIGLSGTYTLDASSLSDGLHTLHYQVIGTDDVSYCTTSKLFLKMTGTDVISSVPLEGSMVKYWYDEDASNIQTISKLSGVYLLDVSSLSDGMHTLHALLVGGDGTVCSTFSDVFIKEKKSQTEEDFFPIVAARNLVYWFDDDDENKQTSNSLSGTYKVDVSSLSDGLHLIHYYVEGENGLVYGLTSTMFLKSENVVDQSTPNAITKYTYWLNDISSPVQTVTLDQAANPYTLMALLPAPKQPIRSSKFHFQVSDGVPTIYAKNDFHIRFYDARGEFVDNFMEEERTFIDYGVSQPVEPVGELQETQRFNRMGENEMRWYTLEAVRGDSLSFKSDKALSIQLFSPSGEEVYSTYGTGSVSWDGCHAREDGTYYLALHDVTATQGTEITLDYQHIDKYAILRQDVKEVGNGGYTTISFEGNGFDDLYSIDLVKDENDSISCIALGIENNAHITPTFDFTESSLGVYDAHFHFAEGDVLVKNAVTVVKATDMAINAKLETPGILVGRGSPYFKVTIVCPNSGNNTAYGVPIVVSFTAPEGAIKRIDITNPEIPTLAEILINEDTNSKDREVIKNISKELGDIIDFMLKKWIIEKTGEVFDSWTIVLSTTIPPESTVDINFQIESSTDIETEVNYPIDWLPIINIEKKAHTAHNSGTCSFMEGVKCVLDGVTVATGFVSTIGNWTEFAPITGAIDCAASGIDSFFGTIKDMICGTTRETFNPMSFTAIKKSSGVWSPILSCLSAMIPGGKIAEKSVELAENIKKVQTVVSASSTLVSASNATDQCNLDSGERLTSKSVMTYSKDPNDIYGYLSPSGSKSIRGEQQDVFYTIEFENDPTFATAPAHDIYVTDTLDATKFDLSTFRPTRVRLGDKVTELSGTKDFLTTIDMRPEINAIAQVQCAFDEKKGIAKWHIKSLDPMTMEPITNVKDGVLPVNTNGQGIGELMYDISLKSGLAHGTVIGNRAGIVFDTNDLIMTPTWTNVIDRIAPVSHVTDVKMMNDSTATVSIEATDELSGSWRYNVYVQYGSGAWFLGAENVPVDTTASVKVYEGINHGFYVVVTDSAGNVEQKEAEREFTLEVFGSQVDTDTQLMLAEGWNWISHNQNEALAVEDLKPSALRMVGQTEETIKDARFGWMGDLEELLPTQMYKLQMGKAANVQLSGRLFNAGFRSIPLYEGWNWIGYPVANVMTPAEALSKLEAEDGDFIIGQDGMATFADGEWTGTLTELTPGQGYMYRSASDKNLFYNATAQASARQMAKRRGGEVWTVDKRKYPNVMAVVATLNQDGVTAEADEWLLAAFCGDECRGVASTVNGVLMMNVYGTGSEPISFYAMNRETEEVMQATEIEGFRADVLGSMQHPYELHIGEVTGIKTVDNGQQMADSRQVYDLQGRRIGEKLSAINAQLKKGIYIVTDDKNTKTQKVVRK